MSDNTDAEDGKNCLHLACKECNGTGLNKRGRLCIHMISCPCEKCSPARY